MPGRRGRRAHLSGGWGVAKAVVLLVVLLAWLPEFQAGAAQKPAHSGRSDLQEWLLVPGGTPRLPAACNPSWPTKAWPPRMDPQAEAHALRPSDVPTGMEESPPRLASNAPNLDELAVGFPRSAFAEVSFSDANHVEVPGSAVEESVGRAPTPSVAASIFRIDRDLLFGSCQRYWPGSAWPRYALAGSPPGLFAYESSENSHGFSGVQVVIVGYRGRFVFTLSVDTYAYTTDPVTTPITAAPAAPAQVSAVLNAALARLLH